jgi:hypothetical protein
MAREVWGGAGEQGSAFSVWQYAPMGSVESGSSAGSDGSSNLPRLLVGREPQGLPNEFLTALSPDAVYFTGTTTRVIQSRWRGTESGLILPEYMALPPSPIDQITVFLSSHEIFGVAPSLRSFVEQMKNMSSENVLINVAIIFANLRRPGARREDVDKVYATQWFLEPVRTRVLNLLRQPNRGLIVPQVLYLAVQHAMVFSGDMLLPGISEGIFPLALLVIGESLGADLDGNDGVVVSRVPGALGREMISNQLLNTTTDEAHMIARFFRIWIELPRELEGEPEVADMAKGYEELVGVPLSDVLAVGLMLFSATAALRPVMPKEYLAGLPWGDERLTRSLDVFVADMPEFRYAVLQEVRAATTEWMFDSIGRYPVVRLWHGGLVVLDSNLLLNRLFGWLPIYDIAFAARRKGDAGKKKAHQLQQSLRRLTEKYCAEVLDAIAPSMQNHRRVYHDAQLRRAFSGKRTRGVKIADAVIDYGDAWVVIELTTSKLKRESVFGISDAAVVEDLTKLVGEVEQIDSTIKELRAREERLTERVSLTRRRFYPLLVTAEGFPVNPVSLTLLREHVQDAGLLKEDDIAPLEVADIFELEIVEGLQEHGGPGLRELLEGKQRAGLWRCSLHDYILVELHLDSARPRRISRLWRGSVDKLSRRVFGDEVVDNHPL